MFKKYCAMACFLLPLPAEAAPSAATEALFDALRLGEVIAVMRDEGVEYGADLREELFPETGAARWSAAVERVYDVDRMEADLLEGLDRRLPQTKIDTLTDFFTTEPGQTIVDLEVAARRAMQDDAVEAAAEERAIQMRAEETDRIGKIDDFIASNDLIEMNIVGAMNANFAFYQGMAEGGVLDGVMEEDQMIADIWAQEPGIRADTEDWIYGYLALAYEPLSDEDLAAYVAFSDSEAGQALNAALFAEFDALFVEISQLLGLRAASFMQGQDI